MLEVLGRHGAQIAKIRQKLLFVVKEMDDEPGEMILVPRCQPFPHKTAMFSYISAPLSSRPSELTQSVPDKPGTFCVPSSGRDLPLKGGNPKG